MGREANHKQFFELLRSAKQRHNPLSTIYEVIDEALADLRGGNGPLAEVNLEGLKQLVKQLEPLIPTADGMLTEGTELTMARKLLLETKLELAMVRGDVAAAARLRSALADVDQFFLAGIEYLDNS